MKKVIDTIKSFFENNDWKYNFNELVLSDQDWAEY